ncbi:MAG: VCBS repeat-containing protein [Acidobacteria bacterium]|nr:VCBS repeat-containing protein [Acidobacteriota bacterium]
MTTSGSTFVYNGAAAQAMGNGLPASVTNLTIDNAAGVTLSTDVSVTGTLTLTQGKITSASNTISIPATATVARTSGHVVGNLQKTFGATGVKDFEVGTANGYSPVSVNVTALTATPNLTVKAIEGPMPGITGTNKLARYWRLTSGGTLTSDLTFNYLPGDVVGTEANYQFVKSSSSVLTVIPPSSNGVNYSIITGVTNFSDWTLAEPSAVTYAITPSAGTGGTITPNTVQNVTHGSSQAFTIAADSGYVIGDVLVDGVSVGAVSNYNFTNVTATHTIAASFVANPLPTLGNYDPTAIGLSGNATVTPDAVPTNTTSMSVSAPTLFNGGLTADPVTGDVSITNAALAKIPAGAYTVTVTAFGPGGEATKTFALTVTAVPCSGVGGFTSPAVPEETVGTGPASVAVGDFNGDGIQDLAAANYDTTTVSIRLGDGSGGFTSPAVPEVTVGTNPFAVAVGDFNGDGDQDLATANYNSANVSIRLGNGSGGFTSPAVPELTVGNGPVSVAVGDFNGDGIQDLAALNYFSNNVSIRLGNGSGGFTLPAVPQVAVGVLPHSVAIGDFDGDGDQDLAVANAGPSTVSIRLGDGSGGFTLPAVPEITVGNTPRSVAVGDFNGDGNQDLVTANQGSNNVSIRLGNGSGGFAPPAVPEVSVGSSPILIAVGDFNGDGNQDLAAANSNSANVSIRLGNGSGGFTSPAVPQVTVGTQPLSVAVGDFNGDGRQDLATANRTSNNVSIRLGTCIPAPTVASVSPTSGWTLGGFVLTVNGTDLTGASAVTVGGNACPIISNTGTVITCTTPAGSLGAKDVLVTTPGGTSTAHAGSVFTYTAPICPAGKYFNGSICADADPGFYVPTFGQTSQTPCAAGTFQPNMGSVSCNPATAGNYVPAPQATAQIPCAAGTYQPGGGAQACLNADAGSYVQDPGSISQTACAEGSFQPNPGQSSCILAPAGSYVGTTGAIAPTPCAAGSYSSTEGAAACTPAPIGSYVGGSGAITSTPCAAGYYQPAAGQTSCIEASAGYYASGTGNENQTKCELGKYQPATGQSSCILAPAGAVGTTGAIARQCAAGGSSTEGAAACTPAPIGSYVGGSGAITSTPCAAGYYQPAAGQTSCIEASAGHYASGTGNENQTQCDIGMYQPATGQSSCILAPAGSYVGTTGAIAPTPCAAGSYQPAMGADSCMLADAGYYVPTSGQTSQTACPPGTTSSGGATVCTALPFTVTFNANGGSGSMANQTTNAPTALTANAFTLTGYAFAGWGTAPAGPVVYADGATYPFTADATLYAQWTAQSQTLSFNSNGGTAVAPITADYGTAISAPSAPTKVGYTFAGWFYDDVTFASPYTFSTMGPTTTIHAKWTPNAYTLSVATVGSGSVTKNPDQPTYGHGTVVELTAVPDVGWTFNGWSGDTEDANYPNRVPLVIITGESNSGGYAVNADASPTELSARPGVQILNNTSLLFEDLDIGTNNLIGHAGLSDNATHGFELGLANSVAASEWPNSPVYLVKTGQGGSTISQWTVGSPYWTTFNQRVTAAVNNLTASGKTPVVYILYSHGINDAIAGTPVATWKNDTIAHLAKVRRAVGPSSILMTRLMSPTYDTYNTAIDEIDAADDLSVAISVSGATLRDANHWDYAGMKLISSRMVEEMLTSGGGSITANPFSVTMDRNRSLTAHFVPSQYTLTYTAGTGGTISGTSPQTVTHGENGSAVTAVANIGFAFVNWSDASTANPRTDTNVTGNITVTANFVAVPPTVSSVSPTSGFSAGGYTLTVNGANFAGATAVTVGGAACPILSNSGTVITCTAPAHAGGAVSVLVTTPGGTNAANTLFTYVEPTISVNDVEFIGQSVTDNKFSISLSGPSSQTITVDYQTNDITATGAAACGGSADYETQSGTLQFDPGVTVMFITVPICPDSVQEPTETFSFDLSNASAGTIADAQGIGTISSDDSSSASIGDVTLAEGNAGPTTFSFPVTLTNSVSTAVTINYTVTPGSATTPSDYSSSGTSIIIPANTTGPVNIDVTVNGDTDYEANEAFTVAITSSHVAIGTGTGTGTITNDDAPPGTLVVTNTSDNDGICLPGDCSLRQAINSANVNADATTIEFDIPGAGVQTISPVSPLPSVSTQVIIDGYSQPLSVPNTNPTTIGINAVPLIELSGASAGGGADGLRLAGGGSTVRGLIINRFSDDGISIVANSDSNSIQGNFIGTDATGTVDLGNSGDGISSDVVNVGLVPDLTLIGGTNVADRNLISGNNGDGIDLFFANTTTVQGNIIGLQNNGIDLLGNNGTGINASVGEAEIIGGTNAAARNMISGNGNGISVNDSATIQGNYIGTDVSGTLDRGNTGTGISMNVSLNNLIGGTAIGAGNLISGNGQEGILIGNSDSNTIQGNLIGTQADGTSPLGNGDIGISVFAGTSSDNVIGGVTTGAGNTIAFNGDDGIQIAIGAGNRVSGNSIHSNGTTNLHLGIDLIGTDGVDANDSGDGDTGPNGLQNFPVITTAEDTGSTSHIVGYLNSTPSTTFAVDIYSNDACDASGYGEGKQYLGSFNVTTDAFGDVTFDHTAIALTLGKYLTATATDPSGNTSEFSACQQVTGGSAGTIQFSSVSYNVGEGASTATITFDRIGGTDGSISATFTTSDGTAVTPGDYTAVTGHVVTFTDGDSTQKQYNVTIVDDLDDESDETVGLELTSTTINGTPAGTTATLTIIDNDAPASFNIVASAGPNGSISPSGTVSVLNGANQAFTITPNAGFSIANVLVDSVSVGAVSNYTFTNVTAGHTISASFIASTYTVTFDANGGSGSMANQSANAPTALTANNFTRSGYTFAGWGTSAGGPVVYSDGATYPFTADVTLYAQWTIAVDTYLLTVNSANGTVVSTPAGINCPGDCSESFDDGTVVTLEAAPDTGYRFVSWSAGVTNTAANPTTVTMDSAKTITANYALNTISGNVNYATFTSGAKGVPNVGLSAAGSLPQTASTDLAGYYSMSGFGAGAYTVTPAVPATQPCLINNGINALDSSLVQQQVVGLIDMTAYQKAAAKVTGTLTPALTSFDAALIAQKSVGICSPPIIKTGQWVITPADRTHIVVDNDITDDFDAYMMGDVDGSWDPLGASRPALARVSNSPDAVQVGLPAVTADAGTRVSVPLRMDNMMGRGVTSYQFDIEYDPTVIEPAELAADLVGAVPAELAIVSNAPIPGVLKVTVYGAFPATGDGVYANLHFNVRGAMGSSSPLAIRGFMLNDDRWRSIRPTV